MKMKNLLLLLVVLSVSSLSCEKSDINEETSEFENNSPELYSIDKGDIVRPGDKPN